MKTSIRITFIILCGVLFCSLFVIDGILRGAVPRDKVYLKNGRLIEGTITSETDANIKLIVDGVSEIKIPRETIQFIKKVPKEVIQKQEEFDNEQEKKGLIKYQGKWITKEQHSTLSERDLLVDEISQLREEKKRILEDISQLEGARTYENKIFQFSFNPPNGWEEVPVAGKDTICRFNSPEGDEFIEYVEVSVTKNTQSSIDQNFIDGAIKGLEETEKGYLNKIRGFDITKVDGLNALKIVMSRYFFEEVEKPSELQEPYHQKLIVYLIIGATKLYRVEFSCLMKDSARYEEEFDRCIKSFIIKDRKEEKSSFAYEGAGIPAEKSAETPATLPKENETAQPAVSPPTPDVPIYEQVSQVSEPAKEFGFDKLYLKDGRVLQGTIMQESNTSIKIRVESPSTPEYVVSIPRDTIKNIEWLSEEERQKKLKYEEEQLQKGMVKFYGHWITREERARFYNQAEEEQEEIIRSSDLDKEREKAQLEQKIQAEKDQEKENEVSRILAELKKLEDEKAELMGELNKQRDITNKKLDEYLERERQEVPTAKVAEHTLGSIVKIRVRSKYSYLNQYRSSASGAVIDSRGIIITNFYIAQNPYREEWAVELRNGDQSELFEANVLKYDPILDVAIIRIDARGLTPIAIGNSDRLREGDQIINVGAPRGYSDSYTVGRVISLNTKLIDMIDMNVRLRWNIERKYGSYGGMMNMDVLRRKFCDDYGDVMMIQHNAITYAQNNGGPLLDKNSALVGINQNINFDGGVVPVVVPPSAQGFNMAVAINSIKKQSKFASYLR